MLAAGDARAHVRRRPAQRLDDPRQAPASPDHGDEEREDDSKAHGDLTHGGGPRILGPRWGPSKRRPQKKVELSRGSS